MEEPKLTFPTFSLSGRKAVITGASRGIGRALGVGLAHAGADVALVGRTEDSLKGVAEEIRGFGGLVVVKTLDVRDTDAISPVLEFCREQLGGMDILINNAGIEKVCDSLEVSSELWDLIVNTNLKGAFFCAQAAARIMIEAGSGVIINTCSLTSCVGVPTATPYTSSKSGLLGMTRALSSEWAPKGIRVNCIAPGYFRTQLTDIFFQNEAWAKSMLEKIPMRRFGHVEDLIGAVVFLCSDAASYVTGEMIAIDGGYLASI